MKDFGVPIDWYGAASSPNQGILGIVEAKIEQSEIEVGELVTSDIWSVYFDEYLMNKSAKQYLLDVSMFKPRTLVMLLSSVSDYYPNEFRVTSDQIQTIEAAFSGEMWREVEEELRTSYSAEDAAAIKKALRGMPLVQTRRDFEQNIVRSCQKHDDVRKALGTPSQVTLLLEALYRVGAIGTRFSAFAGGRTHVRDAWVFRHSYEPRFDGEIAFHVSLRKALQIGRRCRWARTRQSKAGRSSQQQGRKWIGQIATALEVTAWAVAWCHAFTRTPPARHPPPPDPRPWRTQPSPPRRARP